MAGPLGANKHAHAYVRESTFSTAGIVVYNEKSAEPKKQRNRNKL